MYWVGPFLQGLGWGAIVSVMLGPVFFALIQKSLEKGLLQGMLFALGIVLSDTFFFIISYLGVSQLSPNQTGNLEKIMAVVGGGVLLLFGLQLIRKAAKSAARTMAKGNADLDFSSESQAGSLRTVGKGFLLNGLNPFVMLFWITTVGTFSATYALDERRIFAFFLGCMMIIFTADILKAFLAHRLKRLVTSRFLLWLNRVAGTMLMLGGLKLLYDGITLITPGL